MGNILKLGIVFVFLLAGVFVFSTRQTQATSGPVSEAKYDGLASPRTLYMQNCARCHGANGKAQTAQGRRLEADDLTSGDVKGDSTAKITRAITNGRGKMPGFKRKLTTAQISSLVGYVRSL
jgi:mono/diheme cytochrome c family protein